MKDSYLLLMILFTCCKSFQQSKVSDSGSSDQPNALSFQKTKPSASLEIIYDYNTKMLIIPEKGYRIKYGGVPIIVVENINTTKFDIEVDEQQMSVEYAAAESGTTEKGGRTPASADTTIPEVNEAEKIKDKAVLLNRAKTLTNKLNAYVNSNIDYIEKSFIALVNSQNLSFDDINNRKAELNALFTPLRSDIMANYNSWVKEYLYLESQLLERKSDDPLVASQEEKLAEAFDEFTELDLKNKLLEIDSLSSLLSRSNFKATYIAPVAKADEISYTLTIETKDESPENYKKTVVPINVRVAGNWKIDVSTGAMFNINLIDDTYRFDETGTDTYILVKDAKRSIISPTLGLLTHVYKKNPSYTNWGVSFGLGINDEQKLRYFGGLGLMLGERQRFIMSGGLAASPVKTLLGKYHEGQTFTGVLPESTTQDVYKVGFFVSLTYNMTSNNRKIVNSQPQD